MKKYLSAGIFSVVFAVFQTGGSQYRVREGQRLSVNRLPQHAAGARIRFENVMLVTDGQATHVGQPFIQGAVVEAFIAREFKDDKVIIFKKRRRKNYRRKNGFRAQKMELTIEKIVLPTAA